MYKHSYNQFVCNSDASITSSLPLTTVANTLNFPQMGITSLHIKSTECINVDSIFKQIRKLQVFYLCILIFVNSSVVKHHKIQHTESPQKVV